MECKNCGMEIEPGQPCLKCDMPYSQQHLDELYTVDVAHSGEDWGRAREKIMAALDVTLYEHYKGLKIIHGKGSHRGSGEIRARATSLMRQLAKDHGGRFAYDKYTEGASLIYFNERHDGH